MSISGADMAGYCREKSKSRLYRANEIERAELRLREMMDVSAIDGTGLDDRVVFPAQLMLICRGA